MLVPPRPTRKPRPRGGAVTRGRAGRGGTGRRGRGRRTAATRRRDGTGVDVREPHPRGAGLRVGLSCGRAGPGRVGLGWLAAGRSIGWLTVRRRAVRARQPAGASNGGRVEQRARQPAGASAGGRISQRSECWRARQPVDRMPAGASASGPDAGGRVSQWTGCRRARQPVDRMPADRPRWRQPGRFDPRRPARRAWLTPCPPPPPSARPASRRACGSGASRGPRSAPTGRPGRSRSGPP